MSTFHMKRTATLFESIWGTSLRASRFLETVILKGF
jgi:hypothetical protein